VDFLVTLPTARLYVFLGDGTGNFKQVQSIPLAGPSYDLQSADINGDGNLDLMYVRSNYDSATNTYSGVGTIRWGRGDGTFATSNATYLKPAITNPLDAVAVADFDNDGRLDVALLAGRICGPSGCALATADTVWMYKNNGGGNLTLASQTKFAQDGGTVIAADINGDLNQDLIYYNPFAMGIYPLIRGSGGFQYALGLVNDKLGTQGILPDNGWDVTAAFRDMDSDSRADYAVIDWGSNQLGIGIQTGGLKNCPPPSSANLAAKIYGIKDGATVTSPVWVRASGNSPAGVNQLQVWIDGKKRYTKWGDQLAKKFTLGSGKHRIAIAANDKLIGTAKTIVSVNVP
jgi:FG-GAP-like repeat